MGVAGPTASRDLVSGRIQLCPCLHVHPEVASLCHTRVGQTRVPALFSHTALCWFPDLSNASFPFHHGEFGPSGSSPCLWGLTRSTPILLHRDPYLYPMRMVSVLGSAWASCPPRGLSLTGRGDIGSFEQRHESTGLTASPSHHCCP